MNIGGYICGTTAHGVLLRNVQPTTYGTTNDLEFNHVDTSPCYEFKHILTLDYWVVGAMTPILPCDLLDGGSCTHLPLSLSDNACLDTVFAKLYPEGRSAFSEQASRDTVFATLYLECSSALAWTC